MTKDYELYEPYRDWDPFVERQETASLKVESRKTRDKKKANKHTAKQIVELSKRKRIRKSKQKEL